MTFSETFSQMNEGGGAIAYSASWIPACLSTIFCSNFSRGWASSLSLGESMCRLARLVIFVGLGRMTECLVAVKEFHGV